MKRSRALAAALYPGACLPSFKEERMRSRTASRSGIAIRRYVKTYDERDEST